MNKASLLYIEGDDKQRRDFVKKLRSKGFTVHSAPNGHEGLQKFKKLKFDAIICDLNMPELSGLDILKNVRKINDRIPFLMLTSRGSISQSVQAIKQGAFDFILKPININLAESIIKKSLFEAERRKRLENQLKEKYRKLEESVKERTESLEYANKQLAALNRVSNQFTQIFDENEFLDRVPHFLTHSLDFDRAVLMLEEDGELKVRSFCLEKDPPEFVDKITKKIEKMEYQRTPHFMESLKKNKTIFIPDLQKEKHWPKDQKALIKHRSVVIAPIRAKNKPIGILAGNMQYHEKEMDEQDINRFETFVNMVGLTLDDIRAYQSLEKKVDERTKSLKDANDRLRSKTKELEKTTYSLGRANVEMLSAQEMLEEKQKETQMILTELSESRDELQAILDSSFNVILLVDKKNKIVATNRLVKNYFGLEVDEVLHQSFKTFTKKLKNCLDDFKKFEELTENLQKNPVSKSAEIDLNLLYEREVKVLKPVPRIVSIFSAQVLDKSNRNIGMLWVYADITKIKMAEEQLRTIVEVSPIPFLISRISDSKVLYANKPLADLTGMSPKKAIGQKTLDFYYEPNDRNIVLEKIKEDGHLFNHEIRIKGSNGKPIWMILSLVATELKNEQVVVGALYDINERKKAELALERERNFNLAILDIAGALVVVLDTKGRVVRFNRASEKISGYSFDEVKGKSVSDIFVLPEEKKLIHDRLEKLRKGKYPVKGENFWITKSGEKRLIAWSNTALKNKQGKVEFIIAIGIDITEQKQAEDKLKLYREIFMNSSDGIAIFNSDGYLFERNPAQRRMSGYSDKDIKGKHVADMLGKEAAAKIKDQLSRTQRFRGEIAGRTKQDKKVHLDLSIYPILDNDGEISCYVGMGRDISERVEAEQKIATRLRYEKGLATASEAFLTDYDINRVFKKALTYLRIAVSACRVYIFENFEDPEDGLCMRQIYEVCAPGIEPQIENELLRHAPYKDGFDRWKRKMMKNEPIVGITKSFPKSERDILIQQNNLSMLVLPIWIEGVWYGFIGFDDTQSERIWNDEDIMLLQTAAKIVGGYIVRKNAEKALLESEERFRNLVENANDIIYSLSSEGVFEYVSPNWTNILGHGVSEVEGKSFAQFVHPDDLPECLDFLNKVVQSGERQSGIEYRVKHKDGKWRWHTTSASPMKDENGNVISFVGIARDITEIKKFIDDLGKVNRELRQTQSQLVQSEKMAALGMLVAGIAHEINTPVGAINSMHNTSLRAIEKLKELLGEQLSSGDPGSKKVQKTLTIIEDANKVISSGSDRVMNIVKRLRSFARLDEAELKKSDINEGIEDTLTIAHHELKHDTIVEKSFDQIPPIACFPGRLNQVFLNLLVNARQAIKHDHGKIKITTKSKDNKIFISIEDNGIGIQKENLKNIFDPGFTTKGVGVGTGLGLSICYQIIEDHHGEIKVESEVGKGTKFTIIFPSNLDEILENT